MNNEQELTHDLPELIDMVGARFETVVRMGAGDAGTVLFRTHMPAGKMVPPHSHIDPECFYVLSGQIQVGLDGELAGWHTVDTGRSLLVANGTRHAVRNSGDQPADLIVVTNSRLARYFREAGRPASPSCGLVPPTAEDIERLLRVAHAFGYWIASPAEAANYIASVEIATGALGNDPQDTPS